MRKWSTAEKLRLSKFSQGASTQQSDSTPKAATPEGNQAKFGVHHNMQFLVFAKLKLDRNDRKS
jgi:hypothetical protein